MHPVLQEYEARVDDICGAMVRLCLALPSQRKALQKLVEDHALPLQSTLTTVTFGNTPTPPVHTATFAEHIQSLEEEGDDEALVGNVCTSFIYSLWEDMYRPALAKSRGVEKNFVRSEFFRQLGTYRHSIIHNQAIGTSKTATLTLLPAVPKGALLRVTRHVFESMVSKVKAELHVIVSGGVA
jgi:hypothetical protein